MLKIWTFPTIKMDKTFDTALGPETENNLKIIELLKALKLNNLI